MEYCPILLKIVNKILLKDIGREYLLQVWNQQGKMVFQRPLREQLKLWGITNEYFIYKPPLLDEDSDCYHVTDLRRGNATLLIRDPINDPSYNYLAYGDGILYIANSEIIYLLDAKVELKSGEVKKVDLGRNQLQRVVPGPKIHGLIFCKQSVSKFFWKNMLMVALETQDNQIDFSQITATNFGQNDFSYQLRQLRETVWRGLKNDPIDKFTYIVDENNVFYGIAMRESGLFDIYWNMTLVDSPPDVYIFDIEASFDTLYVRLDIDEETIMGLDTMLGASINYEQAVPMNEDFDFGIIFYQNIKNNVNLYTDFTLIRTTLYISHGEYVSLYNIQESTWIKHCKFQEGRICSIFKKQKSNDREQSNHDFSVLLENGSIYDNMLSLLFTQKGEEEFIAPRVVVIEKTFKTHQVPGKIVKTAQDKQRNEWFYIMTRDNDTNVRLFTLHFDKVYEVQIGLMKELDEYTNFVHIFCPSEKSHLAIQKDAQIAIYEISILKSQTASEEFETLPVEDCCVLNNIFNKRLRVGVGNVHSIVSLDLHDHFMFLDQKHFFVYQAKTQQTKVYEDQNAIGAYVVDDKFCYTLSHSSSTRSSGLRLYDIQNMLKKGNDISYKLSNVQVGISGVLDWNQDYSRFCILQSLDCMIIVPALHRNTIAFIGMNRRESYLATKMIKDKFIALDKNNYLFCWSIVTGKLKKVTRLPNRQDFSMFEIFKSPLDSWEQCPYQHSWYDKVLLVKQVPEDYIDEQSFYKEEWGKSKIKNQIQFVQMQKKEFREFRLVEIMSESEVKEHLVFIHPYYMNQQQRLYFDSTNYYMIEKLGFPRIFIYEKEKLKETRRFIKWRCMKRFNKFPEILENDCGYLRVLSPTFQYYIDIDRRSNQFIVRDTFSQIEIYRIPLFMMNIEEEDPHLIMNRFKWIDECSIKLINKEGIEAIVDLSDNYNIVSYNMIPLFDNKELLNPLYNYFINRMPLNEGSVKERLIRKYQSYKTCYYLDQKRESSTLYDVLFDVDYTLNKCKGMHVADLSFTFLHWKMMEQLEEGSVKIEEIDLSQIEILCYNILPMGNTLLHKLSSNSDTLAALFKICQPNEEDLSQIDIHMPVLQNLEHKSAMHLCKDIQDIKSLNTIMKYLCGYGIDHHSRAIIEVLPFCIEKQIPSILDYLSSRMQSTELQTKLTKGCLNEGSKGIIEISLWFGEDEYSQRLMKPDIEGEDSNIEKPIRVEFIDIPYVYHFQDELCHEFFESLAGTDQYEVFQQKPIQKLIQFNYLLVKIHTIKKLQIPFMCFQATLFVYLNFILGTDTIMAKAASFPMQILLGVYACYFLKNEFNQMLKDGFSYFLSLWNYIDIVTPCTVLTVLICTTFNLPIGEENERILQAIGVFFMWFKFVYFLRIFVQFGYLIRLIITVVSDMSTFLVVFFFTLVAFGDTFMTISKGNTGESGSVPFIDGFTDSVIYTYLISLGSFEFTDFEESIGTPILITMFIMCTVVNSIMMLNLLIAIISETFENFKANSTSASFQEMASMIAENAYLIPEETREHYALKGKYILNVTDLEDDEDGENDERVDALDQFEKSYMSKLDKMISYLKKIKKFTQPAQTKKASDSAQAGAVVAAKQAQKQLKKSTKNKVAFAAAKNSYHALLQEMLSQTQDIVTAVNSSVIMDRPVMQRIVKKEPAKEVMDPKKAMKTLAEALKKARAAKGRF